MNKHELQNTKHKPYGCLPLHFLQQENPLRCCILLVVIRVSPIKKNQTQNVHCDLKPLITLRPYSITSIDFESNSTINTIYLLQHNLNDCLVSCLCRQISLADGEVLRKNNAESSSGKPARSKQWRSTKPRTMRVIRIYNTSCLQRYNTNNLHIGNVQFTMHQRSIVQASRQKMCERGKNYCYKSSLQISQKIFILW